MCVPITVDYILETSSVATFPTLNYLQMQQTGPFGSMFPQNISDYELIEFGREKYVKLNINYDNLYYTSIDDNEELSSNDLFGLLGGQLGLFLGSSVISLSEIIVFLIAALILCIKRKKSYQVDINSTHDS